MRWVSLIGGKSGTLCSSPTSFPPLGSPSPAFCTAWSPSVQSLPPCSRSWSPASSCLTVSGQQALRLWEAFLVTVLFLWLHAALFLGQFSFFAAVWFLASWGRGGGHSEFLGLEGAAIITLDFRVGRVWNFMLNIILSILKVLLHFLRASRVAVLLVISRTWSCVFLPSSLAVPKVCLDVGVGCSAGRGWFWRVPLCLVIPWWVSLFFSVEGQRFGSHFSRTDWSCQFLMRVGVFTLTFFFSLGDFLPFHRNFLLEFYFRGSIVKFRMALSLCCPLLTAD